jgi:hypothetical protein
MAGEPGGLNICFDESMGRRIAAILVEVRAPGHPGIHDMRSFDLAGQSDELLMGELARRRMHVLVTKDSRILAASIRRDAWRASGLTLFVLDGKWGNLSIFEQVRGVFFWWPRLIRQAREGPQGSAWNVPVKLTESSMRRVFPD